MRNISLLKLYQDRKKSLSFGCPIIDRITGGISRGIVTELCGEAGSGKTQICLKLALQAQLPIELGGIDGKVAYISCGEGEFPISRLYQMAERFEVSSGISRRDLLNGVLIEQSFNTEDLLDSLTKQVTKMCTENNIKLLIIDSIAGVVRTEYNHQETDDMIMRSELYFQLSQRLKWLSQTYSLCIVVVNQVTSAVGLDIQNFSTQSHISPLFQFYEYQDIDEADFGDISSTLCHMSEKTNVLPALGLAWAHCVNTRIMLYRDSSAMRSVNVPVGDDPTNVEEGSSDVLTASVRKLSLQSSPNLPYRECQFVITSSGVYGI